MKKENKDKLVLEKLKPLIEQNTILKKYEILIDCFCKKPKYVLSALNNNIRYNIRLKRNKLMVNCFGFGCITIDRTFDNSFEGMQEFNILINALSKYVNLCNEIKQLETAYNITFCK